MKACAGEPARPSASGTQPSAGEPACPSVAVHSRVLIEFCCGPDSKLGDRTRKHSKDCFVIRCTEEREREMLLLDQTGWKSDRNS